MRVQIRLSTGAGETAFEGEGVGFQVLEWLETCRQCDRTLEGFMDMLIKVKGEAKEKKKKKERTSAGWSHGAGELEIWIEDRRLDLF